MLEFQFFEQVNVPVMAFHCQYP